MILVGACLIEFQRECRLFSVVIKTQDSSLAPGAWAWTLDHLAMLI